VRAGLKGEKVRAKHVRTAPKPIWRAIRESNRTSGLGVPGKPGPAVFRIHAQSLCSGFTVAMQKSGHVNRRSQPDYSSQKTNVYRFATAQLIFPVASSNILNRTAVQDASGNRAPESALTDGTAEAATNEKSCGHTGHRACGQASGVPCPTEHYTLIANNLILPPSEWRLIPRRVLSIRPGEDGDLLCERDCFMSR
jgi:hypothetical protein